MLIWSYLKFYTNKQNASLHTRRFLVNDSHLKSPLVPVTFWTLLSVASFWLEVIADDVLTCSGCLIRKLKPSPHPEGSPSPLSLNRFVVCNHVAGGGGDQRTHERQIPTVIITNNKPLFTITFPPPSGESPACSVPAL